LDAAHLPHEAGLFAAPKPEGKVPNLSEGAREYLSGVKSNGPEDLFFHTLAVLNAPAYAVENAGALRQDWPRIPLPDSRKALEASAALGRSVAALLDTEADAPGVTASPVEAIFRTIGVLTRGMGVPPMRSTGVSPVAGGAEHGQDGRIGRERTPRREELARLGSVANRRRWLFRQSPADAGRNRQRRHGWAD
jgi:hypothetical protein